jgi:hypothetical protein
LRGFLEQVVTQAPVQEPVFLSRLRTHFAAEPATLPVVAEDFEPAEHPNLQVALEAYLRASGRTADLVGVTAAQKRLAGFGLSDLLVPARPGLMAGAAPVPGPVEYANVRLDDDRVLTCVRFGLFLIRDGAQRLAVLVRGPLEHRYPRNLHVEVMALDRSGTERFLGELRTSMRKRNVYRGHVLSLSVDRATGVQEVAFHTLPKIEREQIVLPVGVLERVERQTLGLARHSEGLLAAGRHLKRGLLLHGPPGTGKTLTAMYLAGQMRDRTVVLLTGRGLGPIERSCAMARQLQPAIVILEDVDLVAQERTRLGAGRTPLLFELLDEMDGLAEDADVIFLLTTNRPELLEPALAARPGRVDQAVELPLPDAVSRLRLLDLYSRGLTLRIGDLERLVERTEGASPAFIRELLRKAALLSMDERDQGTEVVVEDRHLAAALYELVVEGGELTKRLLGARPAAAAQ